MVEAEGLTVEAAGTRVTVAREGVPPTLLWDLARAAHEAVMVVEPARNDYSSHPIPIGGMNSQKPASNAERLREVARGVLADGRVHERREIARAARRRGLNPAGLTQALSGHFEDGTSMDGRPTYRDPLVPSPYRDPRSVSDDEKPDWLRNHPPAHESGEAEVIAANGSR
jgi:hypothetical protein